MNIFIPNSTDRRWKRELAAELSQNSNAPVASILILKFADPREGWEEFSQNMAKNFPTYPNAAG